MTKDLLQLRRTLLTYLDDVEQIKSIAEDIGIDDMENIGWKNAAVYVWHEVISQCMKDDRLDDLLQIVKVPDPQDEKMIQLDKEIKFREEIDLILPALPFDSKKMGILDTLNCGRSVESDDFWNPTNFGPDDNPLLTCIISGHDSGNPRSLADRLALQFFGGMDGDGRGLCYLRDGNTLRIRPLKLDSKKEIPLHIAIDQYLESFSKGCGCKHSAMAHLVEVDVEASGKILYGILEIVHERIKAFMEKHEVLSLLFVIFHYPDSFDSTHLHQHLQTKQGELQHTRYYRITKGVELQEIKNWFNANSAEPIHDLDKYLDPFLSFWLDEAGKIVFREKQTLPMGVMEKMQRQIFQAVMRREGENNTHGGQA